MKITNISDAQKNLLQLITQLQEDKEPVCIGINGKPVAVLSLYKEISSPRTLGGSWEGKVSVILPEN